MWQRRVSLNPEWYKYAIKDPPEDDSSQVASDIGTLQPHVPPDIRVELEEMQGFTQSAATTASANQTANDSTGTQTNVTSYRGTILMIVAVISILCNIFILMVVVVNRKLRCSIANVLLCHLGILGFMYTLLLLPSYASLAFSHTWHHQHALCVFQGYMCSVLTTATLITLAAISVDKYQTIAAPLHYSTNANRRKMTLCMAMIWITSFLLCSLPALAGPGYAYSGSKACCDIDFAHTPGGVPRWVTLPVLVIAFYVPGGVLLFCYCQIFLIAHGHRKRITAMLAMVTLSFQAPVARSSISVTQPKKQKATWTISIFLGSFILCYIPYTVISIIQVIFLLPINFYVMVTIEAMYQAAPVINAVVYGSMNRALRCCLLYTVRKILYTRPAVNTFNSLRDGGNSPILSRNLSVKADRRLRQVKSSPFLNNLAVPENMRPTSSTPALHIQGDSDTVKPNCAITDKLVVDEGMKGAHSTPALIVDVNYVTSL